VPARKRDTRRASSPARLSRSPLHFRDSRDSADLERRIPHVTDFIRPPLTIKPNPPRSSKRAILPAALFTYSRRTHSGAIRTRGELVPRKPRPYINSANCGGVRACIARGGGRGKRERESGSPLSALRGNDLTPRERERERERVCAVPPFVRKNARTCRISLEGARESRTSACSNAMRTLASFR